MRHFHKMEEVSLHYWRGGPVSWVWIVQVNIYQAVAGGAGGGEFEILPNSPHGSCTTSIPILGRETSIGSMFTVILVFD